MNNMKKKVMASAAMLLVAAVMMTGSSFAWYTISTKGEMENIEVQLKATKNLEIAKATSLTTTPSEVALGDQGDDTTWGSTITSWGSGTIAKLDVPATLRGTDIKTASYSEDGRTQDDPELVLCSTPSSVSDGVGYYTSKLNGTTVNAAVLYAAWLRSNVDLTDVEAEVENADDPKIKTIVRWHKDTDDVNTWHAYDPDKGISTTNYIKLDANEPILVEVIGYIDGDVLFAKDVAEGYNTDGEEINLTFHSDTLDQAIYDGQDAGTLNAGQVESGLR